MPLLTDHLYYEMIAFIEKHSFVILYIESCSFEWRGHSTMSCIDGLWQAGWKSVLLSP